MIAFIDASPRRLRGRADLQGAADRPVDLSRPRRHAAPIPSRLPAARQAGRSSCSAEIRRVCEENFQVYGVRKVWRQLLREGHRRGPLHGGAADEADGLCKGWFEASGCGPRSATRPRPARSIRSIGSSGRRGRTSCGSRTSPTSRRGPGFVYVAFVIDVFARRIVGWRVSRSAHAGFVLDALEQAIHDRRPVSGGGLVHHSDRGVPIRLDSYTERLAEAGIEPSVGSVGDSYDNALAETINGLFKTEVIHRRGPWRTFEAVEFATLEWVDWFNNRRLLEPIGNIPPAEAEARLLRQPGGTAALAA